MRTEFRRTVYGVGPYILRDWFQYAAISETPYPVRHRCVRVRSGNQFQRLRTQCVIGAYVYGAGTSLTSLEGKMAIPLMCSLFRINCVLEIEIEQLEEKLDAIQKLELLNLSTETLSNNYKVKIASKKDQIVGNRSAASQIVAAAIKQ